MLSVNEFKIIWNHTYPGVEYTKSKSRWIGQMSSLAPDETIYIRYVGQTTACPVRRHFSDANASKLSFMTKLLSAARALFPDIRRPSRAIIILREQ